MDLKGPANRRVQRTKNKVSPRIDGVFRFQHALLIRKEIMGIPKLVITALRGGSGKTILSIGIIAALRDRGISISPFKKGPDYIDAGWLALAAGRPCYNLDPFLIDQPNLIKSFQDHTFSSALAIIEGNRGLYDGTDLAGATSTAELAKLLKAPVILCLDCTKSTRTQAAVVQGCIGFDRDVAIKGVVLNRVAGARHEGSIRRSIETFCKIPVLGAIPKLNCQDFPERHMGLVPTDEHTWAKASIAAAAKMAREYLDLDAILSIANNPLSHGEELLPSIEHSGNLESVTPKEAPSSAQDKPRIGIIKDSAFQFYYPENIGALTLAGAEILFISPLSQAEPPPLDALYIGGGFPETHAAQLAENQAFRDRIKALALTGFPIYAECGGLMYMGKSLVLEGKKYPMCGVLPIEFGFSLRPQGHGYTVVTVSGENPYFPIGAELKGHEFHYSHVTEWRGEEKDLAFTMKRGTGLINGKDGACFRNVLGTYTHLHALGSPEWATALVNKAIQFKNGK
jgi:cobyrinic acid a,c-diamide synthase